MRLYLLATVVGHLLWPVLGGQTSVLSNGDSMKAINEHQHLSKEGLVQKKQKHKAKSSMVEVGSAGNVVDSLGESSLIDSKSVLQAANCQKAYDENKKTFEKECTDMPGLSENEEAMEKKFNDDLVERSKLTGGTTPKCDADEEKKIKDEIVLYSKWCKDRKGDHWWSVFWMVIGILGLCATGGGFGYDYYQKSQEKTPV